MFTGLMAPLEAAGFPGTAGMTAKAIDIQFHHISETLDPVTLTAGIKALPTTTCDDCPPLDFLLIGGPDPFTFHLSDRFAEFLRVHVEAGKGIFATCTGALAISPSGVLDGKNTTTNHTALEVAQKMSPNVKCGCWASPKFPV
jgi:transcriptional regulator GlxA family with amidase domain